MLNTSCMYCAKHIAVRSSFNMATKSTPNLTKETKLNREMMAEQSRINTYKILAKYRTRNMLMFGGLLGSVFGIYAYSMYAVRQEDFSDFEK